MILRLEMILSVVSYKKAKNFKVTKNNTFNNVFFQKNFSLLSLLTNFLKIIGFPYSLNLNQSKSTDYQ